MAMASTVAMEFQGGLGNVLLLPLGTLKYHYESIRESLKKRGK